MVSLRGMRFHARIGILPHERQLPQPLEIDLTVEVAPSALLDYRELYDLVSEVLESGAMDYLERVAGAIADAALSRTEVQSVRVAIRKPHVMLPGPLASAEVELVRNRSSSGAADV